MTPTPLRRRLWGLVLLAAPALVVFGLGRLGVAHDTGILVVLLEPVLLGTALYGAAAFALHRRWRASFAALLTIGTGTLALHLPMDLPVDAKEAPDWLGPLRGCAILPKAALAPVRMVTWTVDSSRPVGDVLAQITSQRPDLVVLLGTEDETIGAQLSEAMGGEVKFFPSGQGVTAAVRGSFQICGGTEDHWVMDLPAAVAGDAQALLTFPQIEHVGIMPLLIVQADHVTGAMDLRAWPSRVAEGASLIASAAHALGPRRMLVVGDFGAPGSAQQISRPLSQSGLQRVPTPPNWPNRIGGLPFLEVHALDQLWAGKAWHAQRARVIDSGPQPRAPIIVDLTPSEAHAR